MNWWWILTLLISLRGEQRWRLEEGRFKVVFDGCINSSFDCGMTKWKITSKIHITQWIKTVIRHHKFDLSIYFMKLTLWNMGVATIINKTMFYKMLFCNIILISSTNFNNINSIFKQNSMWQFWNKRKQKRAYYPKILYKIYRPTVCIQRMILCIGVIITFVFHQSSTEKRTPTIFLLAVTLRDPISSSCNRNIQTMLAYNNQLNSEIIKLHASGLLYIKPFCSSDHILKILSLC